MQKLRTGWIGALFGLTIALAGAGSGATSLVSTDLRDLSAFADAVVQGVVVNRNVQLDGKGVPWTLYTLAVDRTLAGAASESKLTFRCLGGQVAPDLVLQMAGAPAVELGDYVVFLHNSGSVCDVAGLEFGMFWIRNDVRGTPRLVDHEGRAVGGFDEKGAVLSADRVLSANQLQAGASLTSDPGVNGSAKSLSLPPAADIEPLLGELGAFARKNIQKPGVARSVNGVADVPDLSPTRAPEAAP